MSAINPDPSLLDRASHLRTDSARLDELFARAHVIEVRKGRLLASNGSLTKLTPTQITSVGTRYFLGIDRETSAPYFAWDSAAEIPEAHEEEYLSLRDLAPVLGGVDIELALTTVALANWHHTHQRCTRCGAPTRVDLGGLVRVCDVDESQHHPRTDSAVIVLVKDDNDRILLGHNPNWPDNRFSTFAGFLEPGETFEQCVAREVLEEAHVEVDEISYLGSQPWPFPASIMIAFEASAINPDAAQPDGEEITEVRWFSRAELKDATEKREILLPPRVAVARRMIERWYGSDPLTGGEAWR